MAIPSYNMHNGTSLTRDVFHNPSLRIFVILKRVFDIAHSGGGVAEPLGHSGRRAMQVENYVE